MIITAPEGSSKIGVDFINRLIKFYKSQPIPSISEIWQGVAKLSHVELIDALQNEDAPKVAQLLENTFESTLICGLGYNRESTSQIWRSKLLLLAKSLGVLRYENPEQPEPVPDQSAPGFWPSVIDGCELVIGQRMDLRGGGKAFGEGIEGRCVSIELIEAFAVMGLIRSKKQQASGLVEIGAGLGTIGRYLRSYSTYDLPVCSVVHAYLLAAARNEANVWLCGEPYRRQPIRIFGSAAPERGDMLDVVFNQNSMPEIPKETMVGYLRWINSSLSAEGFFLSINHESHAGDQVSVNECAKDILTLEHRFPWWLRPGYVAEIYRRK